MIQQQNKISKEELELLPQKKRMERDRHNREMIEAMEK